MISSPKKVQLVLIISLGLATIFTGLVLVGPPGRDFPSVTLFDTCNIDNVIGASKEGSLWTTTVGSDLTVQGWAVDATKKTAPSELIVQLIDSSNNVKETWMAKYDTDRPDVATVFSNAALTRSGFNLNIGTVPQPGLFKIQLGSKNGGQDQICYTTTQLQVNQ